MNILCKPLAVITSILLMSFHSTQAQTFVRLSSITPGTENAQLIYNGDFQLTGSPVNNSYPSPAGWTRQADMFVGGGTNLVSRDSGLAALAYVSNAAPVGMYQRTLTLEPASRLRLERLPVEFW